MKTKLLFAAAVLALAACQPAPATTADQGKPPESAATAQPDDAIAGCNAKADTRVGPMGPADAPNYTVEAFTSGSICEAAVVTMVIRARDGFPVFTYAGAVQHLFGLADQKDVAGMNKALAEWIDPQGSTIQTTGDLPPWEETEGQPRRAEFPFMPAEWIDKDAYESMRREKLSAYCFPQGMESLKCLALRDGQFEEIGVHLFPG